MILLLLAMEPDNQVKGKVVPTVPRPLPGDIRVLLKKKKSLPEADKKLKKKKSHARISREGLANTASVETRIDFNAIREKKKKKKMPRENLARRNHARLSRQWNYSDCGVYGITAIVVSMELQPYLQNCA